MSLLIPNNFPIDRRGLEWWFSYANSGSVAANGVWRGYAQGRSGQLVGGAAVGSGGFLGDGIDNGCDMATSPAYLSDASGTLVYRAKTTDSGTGTVFSVGTPNIGSHWIAFDISAFYVRVLMRTTIAPVTTTGRQAITPITSGAWHSVAVACSGGVWLFYIDGVAVASEFVLNNGLDGRWFNAITGTLPGVGYLRRGTESVNYFNGSLNNLAYFNRALSATEIKLLHERMK